MEEEIGLPPDAVEVVGFLDSHETLNTGFAILPVVGFLGANFMLSINPQEVAEVFEAPLAIFSIRRIMPIDRLNAKASCASSMRSITVRIRYGARRRR